MIRLTVNGTAHELEVPSYRTLLDCLRYDLGLTGSKEGCGVGVCGACTVLLDGKMISSCIALAAFADGREVTTGRRLAQDEDDLARRADSHESARHHELLHRMKALVLSEPFDRRDLAAVGEGGERDAGADHLAVQEDGARAADAHAAPFLGAREPEIVPEAIEERAVGRNLQLVRGAVDGQADHRATSL